MVIPLPSEVNINIPKKGDILLNIIRNYVLKHDGIITKKANRYKGKMAWQKLRKKGQKNLKKSVDKRVT